MKEENVSIPGLAYLQEPNDLPVVIVRRIYFDQNRKIDDMAMATIVFLENPQGEHRGENTENLIGESRNVPLSDLRDFPRDNIFTMHPEL